MENRKQNPTIEYLRQALLLDVRIDAGMERIQKLRALAERRTAAYGHYSGGGGGVADRRADVVAKIVDTERELDAEIDRMIALRKEIAGVIAHVPDAQMRTLLELRYLNNRTWEQIAEDMHFGVQWLHKLHGRALLHVKEAMESD